MKQREPPFSERTFRVSIHAGTGLGAPGRLTRENSRPVKGRRSSGARVEPPLRRYARLRMDSTAPLAMGW